MGKFKDKVNDILLYSFSFVSLILITILLSSSKNISYNIDEIKKTGISNNKIEKLVKKVENEQIKKISANKEESDMSKNINNNKVISENIINNDISTTKQINKVETKFKEKINIKKMYYTVKRGDTLWHISKKYNIDIYELAKINKIKNTDLLRVGQKIYLIKKSDYSAVQKKNHRLKRIIRNSRIKFIWPLKGKVTSEFGVRRSPYSKKMEFHTGVDIGVPVGKKIKAAESGKVVFSGTKGGYGLTIIIRHRKGYSTLYGHCLISYVRKGIYVRKGQIIGRVGMTGITTGPHVHFEIRKNNVAIDPFSLLNKRYLYY